MSIPPTLFLLIFSNEHPLVLANISKFPITASNIDKFDIDMNPFSTQNAAADGDSSSQLSSDEGEEEDDEAGESRDEIANLARQLGAEGPDLISEQLQVIRHFLTFSRTELKISENLGY